MAMSQSATESNSGGELSQAEAYDILSNGRRRHTLHYLLSRESGTDIGELAEQIAAWENSEDLEQVTSEERRRVYVSLHQTHLPRMDNAGILEYENSRDTIKLTEKGEDLRVYIEVVDENDIPWNEFYLGLSAVAAALVAAIWLGGTPFNLFPAIAWMAGVVLLFCITSVVHVYYAEQRRLGSEGAPPDVE